MKFQGIENSIKAQEKFFMTTGVFIIQEKTGLDF